MEEAESLCDDIAIIDRGRILARGAVPELLRTHREGGIEAHFDRDLTPAITESLRTLPHVRDSRYEARAFVLYSDTPEQTLAAVLAILEREQFPVAALSLGAGNLEQVFLRLTGTRLRD